MRAIRFLLLSALFIFVGIPCLFVALILGLSIFGVVFGIGGAIVGLFIAVIKVSLVVILPIALLVWLFRMVFGRSKT